MAEGRVWTEKEIVDAVYRYNGGCSPGKSDFLASMGIMDAQYEPWEISNGDTEIALTIPLIANEEKMKAYWSRNYGDGYDVKQIIQRVIDNTGYFSSPGYGFMRMGELTIVEKVKPTYKYLHPDPCVQEQVEVVNRRPDF